MDIYDYQSQECSVIGDTTFIRFIPKGYECPDKTIVRI